MIPRRRAVLALGTALAAGALTAVAAGREDAPVPLEATIKVSPDRAGTPSRPRGIRVSVSGKAATPEGVPGVVPRSFDFWLPKGWIYNGAKHPACSRATLTSGGPSGCPPESIMGSAAVRVEPPDGHPRPPRVTVVNGGRDRISFWVVLQNPARVQAVVTGQIAKVRSPLWSYRLHGEIPGSLQIVAGVPIALGAFEVNAGRADWIATTGCPRDHAWRFHLRITSTSDEVLDTGGAIPCS
jgi:hypothetical protein